MELDVSTAGKVRVLVNSAPSNKVTLWLDGKPTPISGSASDFNLGNGRHTLMLAAAAAGSAHCLSVELQDIPGSPARVQIVEGK